MSQNDADKGCNTTKIIRRTRAMTREDERTLDIAVMHENLGD